MNSRIVFCLFAIILPFVSKGQYSCDQYKKNIESLLQNAVADYSVILNQLNSYRRCDKSKEAADYADEKTILIYQKIKKQKEAALIAKQNEELAKNDAIKKKNEAFVLLGDKNLAKANIAYSEKDYEKALLFIDMSLRGEKSPDAALLLTQVINSHPPKFIDHFDDVLNIFNNSRYPNLIGYISLNLSQKNHVFSVFNYFTNEKKTIKGPFSNAVFSPDGECVYVISTKQNLISGTGADAKWDLKVSLDKYNLDLKKIDSVLIPPIKVRNESSSFRRDTESYDPKEYQKMMFSNDGGKIILSGYATPTWERNISNGYPHHLSTIIDLKTKFINSLVDEHELSAFNKFHTNATLIDSFIIDHSIDEILAKSIYTNNVTKIGRHSSNISDIATNQNYNKVAVVGEDNKLTVLERHNGKWNKNIYILPGESLCEKVLFIDSMSIAVTRTDFSITVYSLFDADYFERNRYLNRSYSLSGHFAKINEMSISCDHKWLASASEDKTARVWSLNEHNEITFQGSYRGVKKVFFSNDSKNVFTSGSDGIIRTYAIRNNHIFSLSNNPLNPRHEMYVSDEDLDEGGGIERVVLRRKKDLIRSLKWNRKNKMLVTENYSGTTHFWSWQKGELNLIKDNISEGVPTLDDTTLSHDEKLKRWAEIKNDKIVIHTIYDAKEKSRIALGEFSPDGKYFINFDYANEKLAVWNLVSNNKREYKLIDAYFLRDQYGDPHAVQDAKFSVNSKTFVFPCKLENKIGIGVISLASGNASYFSLDLTNGGTYDINPLGEKIITGCRMGQIIEIDVPKNECRLLGRHSRYVTSAIYSSDGNWMATSSRDRTLRLISPTGLYVSYATLNPIENIEFSPDNSQIFAAAGNGIYSWEISSCSNIDLHNSILSLKKSNNYNYLNNENKFSNDRSIYSASQVFQHNNLSDRKLFVEKALNRKILLSDINKKLLINKIISPTTPIMEFTESVIELSVYKSQAVSSIPTLLSILKPDKAFHSSRANIITSELFPFMNQTELLNTLVHELKQTNDKWIVIGILKIIPDIAYFQSALKEIEPFLKSTDQDIQISAAIVCSKISKNNSIIPILEDGIFSGHELRENCIAAIKEYGTNAVPALIHCLRSDVRVMYDNPWDLAEKAIKEIGASATPLLLDSLNSKITNYDFHGRVATLISSFQYDIALPKMVELLKQYKDSVKANRMTEDLISGICEYREKAKPAIPIFIDIIINQNEYDLPLHISFSFSKIGKDIIPPIINALPKATGRSKEYLYRSLQPFGKDAIDALPFLMEDLKNCNDFNCREILETIRSMKTNASIAIPVLLKRLDEHMKYAKYEILDCLDSISTDGNQVLPYALKSLKDGILESNTPVYIITKKSIENMHSIGIPDSIILEIKDINDMVRKGEYFWGIVERKIGRANFEKYHNLLEEYCVYHIPHYCEEGMLVVSRSCDLFKKFKLESGKYLSELKELLPSTEQCFNTKKEVTDLINFIEN